MRPILLILETFLFWPYVLSWAFWSADQWDESKIARPITISVNVIWLVLVFAAALKFVWPG
jgi:hypothetical protein